MDEPEEKQIMERVRPYEAEYLYKYRSMTSQSLERIFTNNEIFLSDPTAFNDPFECRPLLLTHNSPLKRKRFIESIVKHRFPNYSKHEIKKIAKKNKIAKNFISKPFIEETYRRFIKDVGVYCLSEIPDDILMWAHYSDCHKGICIKFKADLEFSLFWESLKVTYQDSYASVNVMAMNESSQFFNALATKSSHWKYEQERRIVKLLAEGGPGYHKFSPSLLSGVILGALISKMDEDIVRAWLSKYPVPVQIYKATLNNTSYKLDIAAVS